MKVPQMVPASALQKGLAQVIVAFPDRPPARGRIVMLEHTAEGTVNLALEGGILLSLRGNSMVGLVPFTPRPRQQERRIVAVPERASSGNVIPFRRPCAH